MRSDRGKESSEKGGTALPLAEDFYTIQGEGYQTGTAAYFIRLAGCDVRVSVVRCQIHLEYPPLPRIRRRKRLSDGRRHPALPVQ